jgi:putative membrane protein
MKDMEESMHWGTDWHSGWFVGMHLAWWLFWVVVTVGMWAAITRSGASPRAEAALEVLRRRYAEGALTTAEYEERRVRLAESDVAH